MSYALLARADVPQESTWDLEILFPSVEKWEAAFAEVEAGIPGASTLAGKLAEGSDVLLACLKSAEELQGRLGKVSVWAHLRYAADTTDPDAQGRADRAQGLAGRAGAALAFLTPELLEIGPEKLLRWAEESSALSLYRHFFDRLAKKAPHVRSGEVEQTLALAADALRSASRIHGILTDADLTFTPAVDADGASHEIGQSTIGKLLLDPDSYVRQSAWESYADSHLAHKNALAQCLSTGVKQNVFTARVRGL